MAAVPAENRLKLRKPRRSPGRLTESHAVQCETRQERIDVDAIQLTYNACVSSPQQLDRIVLDADQELMLLMDRFENYGNSYWPVGT